MAELVSVQVKSHQHMLPNSRGKLAFLSFSAFTIFNKGCVHPGLVVTCTPGEKIERLKNISLEEHCSCPQFYQFLDFASVFIHSWILTVYNFVPCFFHFVLQNKHFSMFLNSQALLKCIELGAGCLDSQPGAFLPTALAASPPVRPLPHFLPLPLPHPADPPSSQNVLQPLGGPMRMGLPEASRICVGGAVSGTELRDCFQNVPSLRRELRITSAWTARAGFGEVAVYLHMWLLEGGAEGDLHQASNKRVEQPLKQLFPACITCIPNIRAPCLFVGVSSTSPGTQDPCSELLPASSRCRLPVPREVA